MKERRSENRYTRRLLARKGKSGEKEQMYSDIKGDLYPFKFIAQISSFFTVFNGCLHNGFPVAVKHLWYNAWACWPFFFVKSTISDADALTTLNHERIHCRQQWDIHVTISLPLFIVTMIGEFMGWWNPWALLLIPFIPTILYALAFLVSAVQFCRREGDFTFNDVRSNTPFEREAISRSPNLDYLHTRKFWAVLAYTGIPLFKNYL